MSHRTYRTRVVLPEGGAGALDAYAALFGRIGRVLHARMEHHTATNGNPAKAGAFKNAMLAEFGITARQFNAIATSVEGKRSAVSECLKLAIEERAVRIERQRRKIAELRASLTRGRYNRTKTVCRKLTVKQRRQVLHDIHQKSRSLAMNESRLAEQRKRLASAQVSMCFGSRALFHKQFDLEANGYGSHDAWLTDWRAARNNQFLVLGSKDETGGCQGCVATIAADGSLALRVRLPDALGGSFGKHVELHGVRFAYGHEAVTAALRENLARKERERTVKAQAKKQDAKFSAKAVSGGTALTWRFLRDAKGWEVLVSVEAPACSPVSVAAAGRVAVDVNADHLAVSETDYYGNCVASFSVPCRTQGLTTEQAGAVIGDAVKVVIAHAAAVKKPLVLESLDFKHKKRALSGENPAYARMLSSFAYNRIKSLFEARAHDAGLEVLTVNPAYTSVIGRVKYTVPLGTTMHEAAALAIARRSQQVRERAPRPKTRLRVPVKGGVTAWTAPDWMLPQHRAHPWRCVARTLVRPCERDSARKSPAAAVSGARSRTVSGEAGNLPAPS